MLTGNKADADKVTAAMETEKIHVSSVILAANSDYFMRLFSNGMSESSSQVATVQVTEEGDVSLLTLSAYGP